MHFVDTLDIVCLYSLESIISILVIMHSLPFHLNVLTNSNLFSNDLLNNGTINYLEYIFIYTHNNSDHMPTFLQ